MHNNFISWAMNNRGDKGKDLPEFSDCDFRLSFLANKKGAELTLWKK